MKTFKKSCFAAVLAWAFFSGCKAELLDSRYTLELPALPPAWEELFGIPHWRIEWINPAGKAETFVLRGGRGAASALEISVPQTFAAPVTAWPFFPDKGIWAGLLRPAGAIFPFDADGTGSRRKSSQRLIRLSWQGGVDAVLYRELDAAQAGLSVQPARLPQYLDWPRFRELFSDPAIPEKVRADPWIVDWKTAAFKIVNSGFNKRYIIAEEKQDIPIPVSCGPWIGTSPFAAPLFFAEGTVPAFPAGESVSAWFSGAGILKLNKAAWMMLP
jgi:hypothetical protein